jgi:hypothetical protein
VTNASPTRTLYTANVADKSIDELVDLAATNHLSASVEAQFVEYTYSAAFELVGKYRTDSTDVEVLDALGRACQGSIRVALMARRRAAATWNLNPADRDAGEVHRLLTLLAARFIPDHSRAAHLNFA